VCHEGAPTYFNEYVNWTQMRAFDKLIGRAAFLAGDPAIDIGCGTGRWTRRLRALGLVAAGYDVSQHMVTRALEIDPETQYQVASATDLPVEDGSQQLCTAITVLHHLPFSDQVVATSEIARVLRPEGFALVMVLLNSSPAGRWCFPRSFMGWRELISSSGVELVAWQREEYFTPAILAGWLATAWRGVRARSKPELSGRPSNPGRLLGSANHLLVKSSYPIEQLLSRWAPRGPSQGVAILFQRPGV
jgi:SAM-dependent methyltransferase